MTNNPETSEPTTADDLESQARHAKGLVTQIFDQRYDFGVSSITEAPLKDELDAMPREALIMAAWQGIANYHKDLTIWGDTPRVQRLEQEKEYRKSLLSPDELERAINLANFWLDDNFGQ